ncbi:hypothetical protein IFR05_015555, partial [Cadophora sp. M221]
MASQLPLNFLRPMSLPRAATLHRYLGLTPTLTLSQLRNSSTSISASTPSSTSPPASSPTPSSPT